MVFITLVTSIVCACVFQSTMGSYSYIMIHIGVLHVFITTRDVYPSILSYISLCSSFQSCYGLTFVHTNVYWPLLMFLELL